MTTTMSYREALDVLEGEEHRLESDAECRAEAGMGAVSLGYSGYDGVAEWVATHPGPDAAYFERLAEARAVVEAFPVKVTWHSPYTQGYARQTGLVFGSTTRVAAPAEDDIPF